MNKQSEFSKEVDVLVGKSFTDKFIKNEVNLVSVFNDLKVEVERTDIYDNGGIMSVVVDLNEHNKQLLTDIITDFKSYNTLIDLEFNSGKSENQTDLVSIIDYSERKTRNTILFDWDSKTFFYEN